MSSTLHSARPLAHNVIKRSTQKLYTQQALIGRDAQHRVIFLRNSQDRFFYGIASSVAGLGLTGLAFGAARIILGVGKKDE